MIISQERYGMHCCAVHFFGEPFIREHSMNLIWFVLGFVQTICLWFAVNRLTFFVNLRIFSPLSVNFTDSRDRGLAIFCTVIREFLYFWTVIREFWNLLYEIRDNWLFWQLSFEIPRIVNFRYFRLWFMNLVIFLTSFRDLGVEGPKRFNCTN